MEVVARDSDHGLPTSSPCDPGSLGFLLVQGALVPQLPVSSSTDRHPAGCPWGAWCSMKWQTERDKHHMISLTYGI